MYLFFLIQNHQLSKFCTDDLEYMAIFHYFFYYFQLVILFKLIIWQYKKIITSKSHFEQLFI